MTPASAPTSGVLGRRMLVLGWLCALGGALMIFDLLRFLPSLPAEWWAVASRPGGAGSVIDGRVMWADLGLAWLGQWGYLGAFVWIPAAIVRSIRRIRRGAVALRAERLLLATLCGLLLIITALVHLTPLRYPHYNFFVL